jgi:hypothetical protein
MLIPISLIAVFEKRYIYYRFEYITKYILAHIESAMKYNSNAVMVFSLFSHYCYYLFIRYEGF